MNKRLLSLAALPLLAGATLDAQTNALSPAETWKALKADPGFTYASPETRAVVDAVLAQPRINTQEARIVEAYYGNTQGRPAWIEVARSIAPKSSYALAQVKLADNDFSG